jgi:carbon monoxide dehydrogenase subunit G
VIFENSFTVAAGPDEAWKIILNVPEIAPLLPGATLTEQIDERTFLGNVAVKLGPMALSFKGKGEIIQRDDAARTATVRASGSDAKGRGQAKAEARFQLEPDGAGTRVRITTDLALTGAIAQFARGATLVQGVAAELIKEFEQRLNSRLAEAGASSRAAAAGEPSAPPASGAPAIGSAPPAQNAIGAAFLWRLIVGAVRNLFSRRA